jgi:hypothetical protein
VVEGVDRVARSDVEVEADVCRQIADTEFDAVALWVPEQADLVRSGRSLGKFPRLHDRSDTGTRAFIPE